jgi:DNA-binding MarR family transcriptional regulator
MSDEKSSVDRRSFIGAAPARRASSGTGRRPAHPAPAFTHDAQSLRTIGLLFRSLNFNFRQEMDKALRMGGMGLSFGEISPMLVLELHPGINGAQLARHSMVSAQAMNSVLRKLVEKKYVERRPHPDSLRADSWHLTTRGSSLIERARTIFEITTSRMLSGLTGREARNLQQYLRSCAAALENGGKG